MMCENFTSFKALLKNFAFLILSHITKNLTMFQIKSTSNYLSWEGSRSEHFYSVN